MDIIDIIAKKRDGKILKKEEIEYFIKEYTLGKIPDYQAAALVMAIYINGMNDEETKELTLAMVNSGDKIDLSKISENIVDKHSTGGIGDKVTLILCPLIASLGIPVAKMSGRGLGFTGGTADKIESIPGYNVNLSEEKFIESVKKVGISLITSTANLAPADKKIYALRDVIACTESIPLIASSIMSKKIASGANKIVLDVTCGSGAFMKNIEDAQKLSRKMIEIGKLANKQTACVITNMDEPLGYAVGNNLEVIEAINALKGEIPEDVKSVVLALGAFMMSMAGYKKKYYSEKFKEDLKKDFQNQIEFASLEKLKITPPRFDEEKDENNYKMEEYILNAYKKELLENIHNGKALQKFKEMVKNQGGDISYIENIQKFPKAKFSKKIISKESGFVQKIEAEEIGKIACNLGAGRKNKEDKLDLSAGIILKCKVGDSIKKGEEILTLYSNSEEKISEVSKDIENVYKIGDKKIESKTILGIMK